MGYLFKTIRSGNYKPTGIVDIPFLGAKVGEFANWTLDRRGDTGPDAGLYDLHAVFSFLSAVLWEDDEYPKRILVNVSPSQQYRLDRQPGFRMERGGKSLLIEGVTLWRVERPIR